MNSQVKSPWYCIEGKLVEGVFLKRINRFLTEIEINSGIVQAHLHDSGRLKELLIQGARVIAAYRPAHGRKTSYTLYFAMRDGQWFVVNSSLPNKVFENHLRACMGKELKLLREVRFGKGRVDFAIAEGERIVEYIEVKGVNLKRDRYFMFPDAPTIRGKRHVEELVSAIEKGLKCRLVFIAGSPDAEKISMNRQTDPLFAEAVVKAIARGLKVVGYAVEIKLPCVRIGRSIEVDVNEYKKAFLCTTLPATG